MPVERQYEILRLADGVTFACKRCEFTVAVQDFRKMLGSPRTLAAAAINKHCKQHVEAYHYCIGAWCPICAEQEGRSLPQRAL